MDNFPVRCSHSDAAEYALELLANEKSRYLHRSAVAALARIGFRNSPQASSPEWALLNLTDTVIELLHGVERF